MDASEQQPILGVRPNTSDAQECSVAGPERRLVLVFVCLLTVGSHFGKHFISSLGPAIINRLEISRSQYGLIFSTQELPSAVLPVLGGILITTLRLPYGPVIVFLASLVLMGQVLSSMAVQAKSYALLMAGRLLFGFGDGALVVCQGAVVGRWFLRERISTAFGVTLLVSRLGSFAGFVLPGFALQGLGIVAAMWLSAAVCGVSMVAALLYMRVEKSSGILYDEESTDGSSATSVLRTLARRLLASIRDLNPDFWLVAYLWSALASAVFTLLHFGADIASSGYGISQSAGLVGVVNGSLLLIAGLASPFAGWLQDQVGYRVELLMLSFGLVTMGITMTALGLGGSYVFPLVAIVLISAGFALAPVTLMSSVALVVEDFELPAALGVYKATENVALSISHWLAGFLRDQNGTYMPTLEFLGAVSTTGIAAALLLRRGPSSRKLQSHA